MRTVMRIDATPDRLWRTKAKLCRVAIPPGFPAERRPAGQTLCDDRATRPSDKMCHKDLE